MKKKKEKENNGLAIKIFDIDYSFIMKNYLDKELWHKTWTLFQYKNMTITLQLHRIDIYDDSVYFKVSVNNLEGHSSSDVMYFYNEKCDIKFLKKKINSSIIDCINSIERTIIRDNMPEVFSDLLNKEDEIINKTVEEYMNNAGITSKNIIEVLQDNCSDEFSLATGYKDAYLEGMRHRQIPEYCEIVSKSIGKELSYSDTNAYEYLQKARKRLSLINETEVLQNEICKYLSNEDYDINLGFKED